MSRLAVFGASGPTGLQVVRQALAAGHEIVAATRKPRDFPVRASGLEVVEADVTDAISVDRAVRGVDAVISTFGVPYSRHGITVYSRGITNIVQAMAPGRTRRLVCVSSTTLAREEMPGETLFWRKAVIPLLRNVIGQTLYDDMARMEAIVRDSPLDWTIVRPGGLFDTAEPTGSVIVSTGRVQGRLTSRADLALVLIDEATGPGHPDCVIEAITQAAPPSPVRNCVRKLCDVFRRTP